jgi:hypothetical protein
LTGQEVPLNILLILYNSSFSATVYALLQSPVLCIMKKWAHERRTRSHHNRNPFTSRRNQFPQAMLVSIESSVMTLESSNSKSMVDGPVVPSFLSRLRPDMDTRCIYISQPFSSQEESSLYWSRRISRNIRMMLAFFIRDSDQLHRRVWRGRPNNQPANDHCGAILPVVIALIRVSPAFSLEVLDLGTGLELAVLTIGQIRSRFPIVARLSSTKQSKC